MTVPSLSQAASSMATCRRLLATPGDVVDTELGPGSPAPDSGSHLGGEIAFQVRNPLFAAVLGLRGRSAVVRRVLRVSQPLGEPLVWTLSARGERSGHDVEECLCEARSRV